MKSVHLYHLNHSLDPQAKPALRFSHLSLHKSCPFVSRKPPEAPPAHSITHCSGFLSHSQKEIHTQHLDAYMPCSFVFCFTIIKYLPRTKNKKDISVFNSLVLSATNEMKRLVPNPCQGKNQD